MAKPALPQIFRPNLWKHVLGVLAIGARHLNQFERLLNIVAAPDEKADPPGPRKNMMSQHAGAFPQEQVPIRLSHKAIEQAVPVNVAHLFSTKKETDSAEAVHSEIYIGKPLRLLFHGANCAKTVRRK